MKNPAQLINAPVRNSISCLVSMVGLATTLSSVSLARQFQDVSTQAGLIPEAIQSWGNPIWGDMNNDGFLDLIVPTNTINPYVYLNNAGGIFTDIRATCGIVPSPK